MFQTMTLENAGPVGAPLPKVIKALLLDDSNFDRARIRRLSHKTDLAVQLDEVCSIEEMAIAFQQNSYDLIMIDYRLPVGDGLQALNHVLLNPMNRDAGKIMITGDGAVETAVQAMRGGCHDFLTKESMDVDVLREAMLNAMTLARQKIQMQMQSDHQRDIIRQGLIAALEDSEVQGNVVSMLRGQLANTPPDHPRMMAVMDPGDVDVLLAGLLDEDEFVFH
ncbi:MAG: response regulator [Sulfitobacter sp.]